MAKARVAIASLLAVGIAGTALIHGFEGKRNKAYPDPATGGAPWTICWGHTGPEVKPGLVVTDRQCDIWYKQDIEKHGKPLKACIKVPMFQYEWDATLSLAFNIGGDRLCRATLVRKLNAKDYQGAADEFPKWKYANGKALPGLLRRRLCERDLFMGYPTRNPSCPSTGLPGLLRGDAK